MMTVNQTVKDKHKAEATAAATKDFVTMSIDNQLFGIPVLQVQDVLGPQRITPIPLAPDEVAGSLNLRGRIVTAIDVRCRLGLPPCEQENQRMSIAVEFCNELYSLIVDEVGEVLSLPDDMFERNPPTLDNRWREVSTGVYRLEDRLLVIVDVSRLLNFVRVEAA